VCVCEREREGDKGVLTCILKRTRVCVCVCA